MKRWPSDDDESFAIQLVVGACIPKVLKIAIQLGLLELMKKAGRPVSTSEMAAQIEAANPEAPVMIDRLLRVLAANGILECDGGGGLYSLGPVCELFTQNEDGVSLAPLLLLNQGRVFDQTWDHVKDAILEGGMPFERAHGMSGYEYPASDPEYNTIFNQAMSQHSTMFMNRILQIYEGFEGVGSLVNVGGGIGASLNIIKSKYPSIKTINFDLPHVIQNAPPHPEVEHISGDMFVSVPTGDAIFMKWIIHNWSDGHCLKLLKNCYEALPEKGKVIIVDRIISEIPKKDVIESTNFVVDVIMLTLFQGGKERTETEFQALAKASGFKGFQKICRAFNYWVMELYK